MFEIKEVTCFLLSEILLGWAQLFKTNDVIS